MDAEGRERFWNVLKNLHDCSETSLNMLKEVTPLPQTLCRFRPVNAHSLQQLQENKLFFSSADHYDDPFDTYFYINIDRMVSDYEKMRKELREKNEDFLREIHLTATLTNQNYGSILSELQEESLDFAKFRGQLLSTRNWIQRRLFSICFCEDPYNETLWLKYAGNYSGFVQVYDFGSSDTYLCGKEDMCKDCIGANGTNYIYPVYYSNERYDATAYSTGIFILNGISGKPGLTELYHTIQRCLTWEIERISLIKKKCHENDQEWRMIRPEIMEYRSCIKMRPCKIIIGIRTPEYERRLIASAARVAGIQEIHELYINDSDRLDSRPILEV